MICGASRRSLKPLLVRPATERGGTLHLFCCKMMGEELKKGSLMFIYKANPFFQKKGKKEHKKGKS